MQRSWMLGGVVGLLLASTLWGRPGIVKTRDGQTLTGDVTELPDVIIVDVGGIHSTLDRDSVRAITYSDTVEQECRKRLARLAPYDVAGRVELAQWLFENKAYQMARNVLSDAAAISPRNPDVLDMMRTVDRQILLEESQERKHAPVQLAAAAAEPPAGAVPADNSGGAAANRLVTPEEINFIKQAEWQKDESVRVTFRNDVRRKYIAKEGLDPAQFNRMTPPQQAWAILQDGTTEMKKAVILITDPPELATFKKVQQSLIYTGCASCHTAGKAQGNFALHFPTNDEAATYSNFIILQKYQQKIGDRVYLMIDRARPDDSLLIQFSLPMDVGQPPHPKAPNYRGAVRTRNDPRLKTALDWLTALNPVVPDYGDIDLESKPGEHPLMPATRPAPPR